MKKLIFSLALFAGFLAHADIIYTIDLEKALRPLRDRLTALEQQSGHEIPADLYDQVTNIVTKSYIETICPPSEATTNVVKEVVTQDYMNDLGFSFRPLDPITNLVEVTEAHDVGDVVNAVNTLTAASRQLQEQWQSAASTPRSAPQTSSVNINKKDNP